MSDFQVSILLSAKDQATRVIRGLGPTARNAGRIAQRAFKQVQGAAVKMATKARAAFLKMGAAAKSALVGLPALVAGALTGVGAMIGKSLVDAASDAEEIGSKFDVLFEDVGDRANEMADSIAVGLGRSKTDFRDYMSTVQNLLTPMGLVGDAGLDLSANLATLAVDLASFNNAADDEALLALRSALTGETEPLRRFGVMLNESKVKAEAQRLGLVDLNGELSDQAKTLARVSIIQRETAKAQGDVIRTSDSYANSVKALKSQVRDLSVEFGAVLINAIQDTTANLGGAAGISDLVRVGFEFIARAGVGVVEGFGKVGQFTLSLIEKLGGLDQTIQLVAKSVSFMGDIFRLAWAGIRLVFVGFVNGLRSIAMAVDGVWAILKILTGLLGIGFLQAMRGALFITSALVEGFDILTTAIKDGVIFMLQKALDMLSSFAGGAAEFFDFIPGMGDLADAAQEAANKMQGLGANLDDFKGRSEGLEGLKASIKEADAVIEGTQVKLAGFVTETWSGLTDDATAWAEEIADKGPLMAQAWLDFTTAGGDAINKGSEIAAQLDKAITEVLLERASISGQEIGAKTAEEIAAGVLAQKEALSAALQQALSGGGQATAPDAGGGDTGGGAGADTGPTSVLGAMSAGLLDVAESAGIAAKGMSQYQLIQQGTADVGNVLLDGFSDLAMAAVDSTQSMGQAWNQLKQQVVGAIAQMIAKMLAMKAVQALFGGSPAPGGGGGGGGFSLPGFAMGGVSGGVVAGLPFGAFAQGGVVTGPTLALMGENPAYAGEAFIPIPSGGKIPVEGAGGANVTFQITANDTRGFDELLASRRGSIIGMIEEATIRKRSMRQAFADI